MRRLLALLAIGSSLAVLGAVAPASAATVRLTAVMTGAAERPGPGDPDGIGRAVVTVDPGARTVCVVAQFTNVTLPATGFHIHLGPTTAPGGVVIPFTPPTGNVTSQCVTLSDTPANAALLANLVANPGQYYINIHTVPGFAAGAIRGQLSAA